MRSRLLTSIVAGLCAQAWLVAQGDRVPIRIAPVPNQTAHMRSTLDLDVDMVADPDQPFPPGVPPQKLVTNIAFAQTLRIGAKNDLGQIEAEATFDEVTSMMTVNGRAMPMPSPLSALAQQKFKMTYGENGEIVDVSTPANVPPEAVKRMLQSVMQAVPVGTIAVGETITVPLSLTLPLPIDTAALKTEGQTRLTLLSVTNDRSGRVAHYSTTMSGRFTVEGAPLAGAQTPGMTMEMQVDGTGTMDMNLDRGLIQAGNQQADLAMSFGAPAGLRIQMKGKMTMAHRTDY